MKAFAEQKSETFEWYTPPEIFDSLGCVFDLDPASPGKEIVPWIPAKKHFTEFGLVKEWFGRVWLNPPYGKQTRHWLRKLYEHGDGIALVFSRSDTWWFHHIAIKADVICFLPRRVNFINKDGDRKSGSSCGSLMLAYGKSCADILLKANLGFCIENNEKIFKPCLSA